MKYGKLVRDKIPKIIEKDEGKIPKTRKLSSTEYKRELLRKLVEESQEANHAKSSELSGELADVYEVLRALVREFKLSSSRIERLRIEKRKKRGGFSKKIFLI